MFEVLIDGAGVNGGPARHNQLAQFSEITVEQDPDAAMPQHAGEHPGETLARHLLEAVIDVAVVAVEADGDAAAHRRFQVAGMDAPLLQRIGQIKGLVEFTADPAQDEFLGVTRLVAGHPFPGQQPLRSLGVEGPAKELLQCGQVDGKRQQPAADSGADLIIGGDPVGELGQVVNQVRVVGSKVMGAVVMHQDPVGVGTVVAVAGDVAAAIHDQDLPAEKASGTLGDDAPRRPRAADQQIDIVQHVLPSLAERAKSEIRNQLLTFWIFGFWVLGFGFPP